MESVNVDDVNVDDEVVSETPYTEVGGGKTPRKLRSIVWQHFTKIGKDEEGYEKAACNYCSHVFKVGRNPLSNKNYGTSHLGRHLPTCERIDDDALSGFMRKIDLNTHRRMLAEAIIQHDLPFSFVEYEKIRDWIHYLNPDAEMTCRNTAVSDVEKIYVIEKNKLKEMLSRIPNRVCLTSDCWTAVTGEGYICLTAHFADESWKLCSKILNFCRVKPPHTGIELEATLFGCLKEWGIDKKVFSITLDNASANDCLQDILKSHLCVQSNLLSEGEFFHIRCSAHILNLIVQEGLKVATGALKKIRDSVNYVKQSDGRMLKFKECVKDAGINATIGLRTDVSTRWNSTYIMLESALEYQRAFDYFKVVDRHFKCCPSDEEWTRGEKICEFLEPFHDITRLMSGSSYSTSSLYFMEVWKVQRLLEENQSSDDGVIKAMSVNMKAKFDKYWTNYSVLLAFGAILDPRLKVSFLIYCYGKLDPSTRVDKVKNVTDKFEKLYQEYATTDSLSQPSTDSTSLSISTRERKKLKRTKIGFNEFLNETSPSIGNTEIDIYLEEPKIALDEEHPEEFDVLQYWKNNEKKFPILSIMARDILCISITTVASESAFSIGGRVLTKYRSSTLPEHIQMLICTRNWLHGYVENPSDEDMCGRVEFDVHDEDMGVPF